MKFFQQQSGFTLAEMIIVITIISFVTTISLPFYRNLNFNISLSGQTKELASDLRQAQQLAVTEQINYQVIIDQEHNSYAIINTQTLKKIKEKQLKYQITILAINGLINNTVEFNATGAAISPGNIILINPNLRQTIIEIKPSGYVKISN